MKVAAILLWGITIAVEGGACPAADNILTEQERFVGWELLFNGQDYSGWKVHNWKLTEGIDVPCNVIDGAMYIKNAHGMVTYTKRTFGDFILRFDVKMPEACNSGVFYRVENLRNAIHTGFEVQIRTGDEINVNSHGAIYDIVAPTKNPSHGPGGWDRFEIRCEGPLMTVKINDELTTVLNVDELSEPGERKVSGSHKYKLKGRPRAISDFARTGYIGFQDHGTPVWYKNVKILPLDRQP